MYVLVACEESQRVCIAFRERGHEAYSCDIIPHSGGYPEYHIMENVIDILNPKDHGNNTLDAVWFVTMDGRFHEVPKWDLIIAHPPCTYLTVSGNKYFNVKKYGDKAIKRARTREEAINFFMTFTKLDCKWAIENPIGIMSTEFRKPDQIIQPFWFGEPARKSTCLWLNDLPKLTPTEIVDPGPINAMGQSRNASADYAIGKNGKILKWNDPETAKIRSKTFWGIARAMAAQWG